jgi:GNAT superfamily N-acetyltransferase
LLELLNARFISDCRSGGELIATKACLNEMDTFFILEPVSDAVMGYAALIPAFDHGIVLGSGPYENFAAEIAVGGHQRIVEATAGKLTLLSQLYVEPQARKRGLATAALRVLLASHSAAVVESPSLATARAMLKLGFKPVGARWAEACPRVLYVRLEALANGLSADENS